MNKQEKGRRVKGRIDKIVDEFNVHGKRDAIPVSHLKEMVEMERKIRNVESSFASLYTRLLDLEAEILKRNDQTCREKVKNK